MSHENSDVSVHHHLHPVPLLLKLIWFWVRTLNWEVYMERLIKSYTRLTPLKLEVCQLEVNIILFVT